MNFRNLIVVDCESTGLKAGYHEIIQLSACAINTKNLTIVKDGVFDSCMRPLTPETVDAKALEINGHNLDDLLKAPHPSVVMKDFIAFIERFNWKHSWSTRPIPCGHNIGFDLKMLSPYFEKYGAWDKKTEQQSVFHYQSLDTISILFMWFEQNADYRNFKLDTAREYFGISAEGAHNSLKDIQDTARLLCKFLGLHRKLAAKMKLQDLFRTEQEICAWANN